MNSVRRRLRRLFALRPADVSALRWTHAALTETRRNLRIDGTRTQVAPPPPGLPASSLRTVDTWLKARQATCLERSLVVQRWLASHGTEVPVAIGVRNVDHEFQAHAWLPGFDRASNGAGFTEIRRLEPG